MSSQSEHQVSERLSERKSKQQIVRERMEQVKTTIHDLSKELQQLKLRVNPFIPVATDIYEPLRLKKQILVSEGDKKCLTNQTF